MQNSDEQSKGRVFEWAAMVCFGAFLIIGLTDRFFGIHISQRSVWLIFLLFSTSFFCWTIAGLLDGRISLRRRSIRRAEQPLFFWLGIALYLTIAIVIAVFGIITI